MTDERYAIRRIFSFNHNRAQPCLPHRYIPLFSFLLQFLWTYPSLFPPIRLSIFPFSLIVNIHSGPILCLLIIFDNNELCCLIMLTLHRLLFLLEVFSIYRCYIENILCNMFRQGQHSSFCQCEFVCPLCFLNAYLHTFVLFRCRGYAHATADRKYPTVAFPTRAYEFAEVKPLRHVPVSHESSHEDRTICPMKFA